MASPLEVIGTSPGIVAVREQLERLLGAQPASGHLPPILLVGETGTGKGLLARTIHARSARARGPFVDVDCAAIPETLLEAELFGFERGAFTDARQAKPGLFQSADGGTLFLDEIALVPRALQGKLLKAVEARSVRRIGSTRSEPVDMWIIAATNEDLSAATKAGHFREDLYHRLSVLTLALPPLRERGEDILVLAEEFLARACAEYSLPPRVLDPDARAGLLAYPWPGNIRELANVMERVALLSVEPVVEACMLALPGVPADRPAAPSKGPTAVPLKESLSSVERAQLNAALRAASGNVSLAAQRLGLPRTTLLYRLAKLGLGPERGGARRRGAPSGNDLRPLEGQRPPNSPVDVAWDRRPLALLRAELLAPPASELAMNWSRALGACIDKVESFGGRVERHFPRGIVATFGLVPAEDAPIRAALAAIAILKAIADADSGERLDLAAAIHVAGCGVGRGNDGVHIDPDDLRTAEATLSELRAQTEPGCIVASAAAARSLMRRFDLQALGTADEAGARLYRVPITPLPPVPFPVSSSLFVGRRRELAFLGETIDQIVGGRGQVVGIMGEPGVGKSRLIYEFRQTLRERGVLYLEGRCLSHGSATPYLPVLDIVRMSCGIIDAEGLEILSAVTEIFRALNAVPFSELWASWLADGYWQASDYSKARQTAESTLEIATRCDMPFEIGAAHRLLGELALAQDPGEAGSVSADAHFEKSIPILREIGAENELARAYAGYGRVQARLGRVAKARDSLTQALDILERLRTLGEPDRVRQWLAELPAA